MHKAYDNNQARFKRDYVDKTFEARMPFAGMSENLFFKGRYTIHLGSRGITSDVDCSIDNKDQIERAIEFNKGDFVLVRGTVSDHIMGSIILKNCTVMR